MPKNNTRVPAAARTKLLESITRDVTFLVERNRWKALFSVMEATGLLFNHAVTTTELGRTILALAPSLQDHWLKSTAHVAAFERVYRRSNTNRIIIDRNPNSARSRRWHAGHAAADEVLRSAGVAS